MADDNQVEVHGPDGNIYHFPEGTTKEAAIGYFKKKGIGVPKAEEAKAATPPKPKEPVLTRNRMIPGPGGGFQQQYAIPESTYKAGSNLTLEGLGTAAGGMFGSAITAGSKLPWMMQMLARASSLGFGTGAGKLASDITKPKEALSTAATTTMLGAAGEGVTGAAGKVMSKVAPKVNPLQAINELLGVKGTETIPGKVPTSLDEFAVNPARGVLKSGLDEKALTKMDPFERNQAIMTARDKAGQSLDRALEAATHQGKEVNVTKSFEQVFSTIEKPEMQHQVEDALWKILIDNKIHLGQLDNLTPVQAKAVQQGLADLSDEKLPAEFKEPLVRGIKESIKKAVPELAPLNQNYADLAQASKATQRALQQTAVKSSKSDLQEMLIKAGKKALPYSLGAGLLWEMFGRGKRIPPIVP